MQLNTVEQKMHGNSMDKTHTLKSGKRERPPRWGYQEVKKEIKNENENGIYLMYNVKSGLTDSSGR